LGPLRDLTVDLALAITGRVMLVAGLSDTTESAFMVAECDA